MSDWICVKRCVLWVGLAQDLGMTCRQTVRDVIHEWPLGVTVAVPYGAPCIRYDMRNSPQVEVAGTGPASSSVPSRMSFFFFVFFFKVGDFKDII